MTGSGNRVAAAELERDQDLFELANLFPCSTGLPMTILTSQRGRARHAARIRVCMTRGDRTDLDDTAVVAVRPQARLLHGALPPSDWLAVQAWIALNEVALLDYWNGASDAAGFVQRLRKI
jgi:hypothetical protein